jgi:hypothetical protein
MSQWFGGLTNVILRWDQIYLKTYQVSFPSSAHWPRSHSRWMSYGLPNEALSGCRWTESSTLMDLHFETHLYLHSNNDMHMWNQVNCIQNCYANIGMNAAYNQWSYPLVSYPHHQDDTLIQRQRQGEPKSARTAGNTNISPWQDLTKAKG